MSYGRKSIDVVKIATLALMILIETFDIMQSKLLLI
jgi:hypothetical protein